MIIILVVHIIGDCLSILISSKRSCENIDQNSVTGHIFKRVIRIRRKLITSFTFLSQFKLLLI